MGLLNVNIKQHISTEGASSDEPRTVHHISQLVSGFAPFICEK